MSAREDYPLLAWIEGSAPWPEGRSAGQDPYGVLGVTFRREVDARADRWPSIAESVTGVLDHVDALRSVVEAAIVWRQCERAMHGNTSEASRRHHEAVWTAKRRLHDRLDELLVEGAAGRGAP